MLDGSGSPPLPADVGIRGDRIAFVGDAKKARLGMAGRSQLTPGVNRTNPVILVEEGRWYEIQNRTRKVRRRL